MRTLLTSVSTKLFYLFATCIIFVAFLVAATQLITPFLEKHRPDFEKWTSQFLTAPVTINHIRLSWYEYSPAITLEDVTILNASKREPALQIHQVKIFLSFFKSIWKRAPVLGGLMLSGSEVNVYENTNGEIRVQGFPHLSALKSQGSPFKAETKLIDIVGWLSQQPQLTLENIDLHYTGIDKSKRWLTIYILRLNNTNAQHAISGKAVLHQKMPTKINVAVIWRGTKPDLSDVKANLYLYVSALSLDEWAKHFQYKDWQIKSGTASAKIWAFWNGNNFRRVQTSLRVFNLQLLEKNKIYHNFDTISGNFGWKREGGAQVIAGDDILIDLPDHLWPSTSFYLSLLPDAKDGLTPKTLMIGFLNINDIKPYLDSFGVIPDAFKPAWTGLNIRGNLNNVLLQFPTDLANWQHIPFSTNFDQISTSPWQRIPGVTHLSGGVKWDNGVGELHLDSNRLVIQSDFLFNHPLRLEQVISDIEMKQQTDDSWLANIHGLQILNGDFTLNLAGTAMLPLNALPTVNLQAKLSMQQLKYVSRYLPTKVMLPDLTKWFDQAFLSGEISTASATLRGSMADFPFDDASKGLFTASAKVNNAELSYAPDWPHLQHLQATITYTGRRMDIALNAADMAGLNIKNMQCNIPYFGDDAPQILHMQPFEIDTDINQALAFVRQSPLQKTVGKIFKDMMLDGTVNIQLGMIVPLKHPETLQVDGALTLNQINMHLVPWHLEIKNITGPVQFTEDTVTGTNIKGSLFDQALQFNLKTLDPQSKTDDHVVQADFTTHLRVDDVTKWLAVSTKIIQGEAEVQGQIDLAINAPLQIHLQSTLAGIAIDLPDPYGKKAETIGHFTGDIFIQDNAPLRIRLGNGEDLSAALTLERRAGKLQLLAANLQIGQGAADWPKDNGLYITGQFDKIDWKQIQSYQTQSNDESLTTLPLPLKGIHFEANELILGAQVFHHLQLNVDSLGGNWHVVASGSDVDGELTVPKKLAPDKNITADFRKLLLNNDGGKNQSAVNLEVGTLPAIHFTAKNVQFNDMLIGDLQFQTVPVPHGLSIQGLQINSPYLNLNANGNWSQAGKGYTTHLAGRATTTNLTKLLTSLAIDAHNVVASKGDFNFDLSWHDAPFAPDLNSLEGKARLSVGAGRIVDIGQSNDAKMGIGRLLSIFSLQAMPGHLASGFSDLFQKGYGFNAIRGDVLFKTGSAYTNNLRFEGPVAGIGINGRIGLAQKDFDFILSVTPYVASSVPVAATFLAGPWVGLAALAVNAVVSKATAITTYAYAVTGPWTNPQWKSTATIKSPAPPKSH